MEIFKKKRTADYAATKSSFVSQLSTSTSSAFAGILGPTIEDFVPDGSAMDLRPLRHFVQPSPARISSD